MKRSLIVFLFLSLIKIAAYSQTYTLTASSNTGGTITPAGETIVSSGGSQSFTIAAKSGFQILDVNVDGTSRGALTSYAFTNITANHTISATFAVSSHLALNKPTFQSDGVGSSKANDTDGSNISYWQADPYPQWWKVDLQGIYDVTSIVIRNYFDDITRIYRYNIEVSTDDVTYTKVIDKTNDNVATDEGDTYVISTSARYIRVNMLYNSLNSGIHISDFRVYGTLHTPTYTITGSAGAGGSITPGGLVMVNNNANQLFTISPNLGYDVADVIVDGISIGAVSSYTFNNILTNHTISATFSPWISIALDKPATAQSNEVVHEASYANDADGTNNSYWAASTLPQWWQVDLGAVYDISGITIRNYVLDLRYYQYNIEASTDGVTYSQVAAKTNTNPATDDGDSYPLSSTARYLRVNMTFNSLNVGVHISDFRVFGTLDGKTNLTISGVTANNKVYDGTNAATLNTGSATLVGVAGGDVVTLIKTGAAGTFANKNVGTNKTVTASGFTLGGADAGKYILTQPITTANITPAALTVSGVTGNNKVYNGTTVATLNTGSSALIGVLGGDVVSLISTGATGTFANMNVGTGKTITTSGFTLGGADAVFYTLTQPSTTANITPVALTVTADAKSKVLDDPDPALTYQITSGNLVGTDALTGVLSRAPGETAGTYAILQNTLANSNYTITYIGANLTITLTTGVKQIALGEFGIKVYPNPFTDHLYFDLQWNTHAKAHIEIFNTSGVKIATLFSDDVEANQVYRLEYTPENVNTGILFYRLVIDGKLILTDKLIHKK